VSGSAVSSNLTPPQRQLPCKVAIPTSLLHLRIQV
jgi:hypothetical protein